MNQLIFINMRLLSVFTNVGSNAWKYTRNYSKRKWISKVVLLKLSKERNNLSRFIYDIFEMSPTATLFNQPSQFTSSYSNLNRHSRQPEYASSGSTNSLFTPPNNWYQYQPAEPYQVPNNDFNLIKSPALRLKFMNICRQKC